MVIGRGSHTSMNYHGMHFTLTIEVEDIMKLCSNLNMS